MVLVIQDLSIQNGPQICKQFEKNILLSFLLLAAPVRLHRIPRCGGFTKENADERALAFARIGMMLGLGSVGAPLVGGLLAS